MMSAENISSSISPLLYEPTIEIETYMDIEEYELTPLYQQFITINKNNIITGIY